MPVRAFVTKNLKELKEILNSLDKARQSGSLEELRVSGIMSRTGPMKPVDVQNAYDQARYEAYLRVRCGDDCEDKRIFTNPYEERVMRVETVNLEWGNLR